MSLSILQERFELLTLLKEYLAHPDEELMNIYEIAQSKNSWFTIDNIKYAIDNIVNEFLNSDNLIDWTTHYQVPVANKNIKNIGIIMAGNIPLVGFHDVLCTFITGHKSVMKLSSKDSVIWTHLVQWLHNQNAEAHLYFEIKEQIPHCDAYIATGSNNTSRYFESFFAKYPHIIRKNRSSVAVLSGDDNLSDLVHDVTSFYGLGCRNVSQIYLPEGYSLDKILNAFQENFELSQHHGYRNNYDYHLAIYLLNRIPIHYNDNIILLDNSEIHAPIGSLHHQFYSLQDTEHIIRHLIEDENIQCISTNHKVVTSQKIVPLGQTQRPQLHQYADGVDVMSFLLDL